MRTIGFQKWILRAALLISTGVGLFGARAASAETAYHMICRSGGRTTEVNIDGHSYGTVAINENQTRYTGTSSDIRHRLKPGQCSWSTRPIYTGDYGWGPFTWYDRPDPFYFYFYNLSDPNRYDTTSALAALQPGGDDIVANIYVYQRTYDGEHYLVVRNAYKEPF
jgi:hypothetical protein